MVPSAFDEKNCIFNPPEGVSLDDCQVISAFRGLNELGQDVIITCWKPTTEEWEEMRRTGRVWIIVWGKGINPMCPSGINPFQVKEKDA